MPRLIRTAHLKQLKETAKGGEEVARLRQGIKDRVLTEHELTAYLTELSKNAQQAHLRNSVDQLPPDRRLEYLANLYNDEELQVALADQQTTVREEAWHDRIIRNLARIGLTRQSLDLGQVPEHTPIRLSLYNMNDLEAVDGDMFALREGYTPARKLVVSPLTVDPTKVDCHVVLSDLFPDEGGYDSALGFPLQSTVSLGMLNNREPTPDIVSVLHSGTSVGYIAGERHGFLQDAGIAGTPLVLGQVSLGHQPIFA